MADWLIYGAYGYSGELAARQAVARGFRPILAGRDAAPLTTLASELDLEHRTFPLEEPAAVRRGLRGMSGVLNCAGPFRDTWAVLVEACIDLRVHYLDITGEIDVIEGIAARGGEAAATNTTLLPAVGFDVVASDCLAVHLAGRMPGATRLNVAVDGNTPLSHGTAVTSVANLSRGTVLRRDGSLTARPLLAGSRQVDFGFDRGTATVTAMTWGDVAVAYRSTRIPNIETFVHLGDDLLRRGKLLRYVVPLMEIGLVKDYVVRQIGPTSGGPSAEERTSRHSYVWAEVGDGAGGRAQARLRTPNAYTLTAMASVEAANRVAEGAVSPGFQTPATAFGSEFVLQFGDSQLEDV